MADEPRAWLCLTVQKRQYGGNLGYDDDPEAAYRFDSKVAYSRQVRQGDVLVLRDRRALLGFAEVRRLDEEDGLKELLRCPACGTAKIKRRVTLQPRWRCDRKHLFNEPVTDAVVCTRYTAWFAGSWVPAGTTVHMPVLRNACTAFNEQNSIQPINLVRLRQLVADGLAELEPFLEAFCGALTSDAGEIQASQEGCGLPEPPVLRQIRARRGQQQFREEVRRRFGDRCLISGCTLVDLLEAAHIYPYRSGNDNRPANGLLLRCDLHTLFDLDLVGINPVDLTVLLAPEVAGHGYDDLHGRRLNCERGLLLHDALAYRWTRFCRNCRRRGGIGRW